MNIVIASMIILRSEMVPDALFGVPEMMDTPPIRNNCAFYLYRDCIIPRYHIYFLYIVITTSLAGGLFLLLIQLKKSNNLLLLFYFF